MERRVSNGRGVWIRSFLEQQSRRGPVATLGRKNEGAHSIGQGVVYIGAGCKQRVDRPDISGTRRKQQRRASTTQHRIVQLFAPCPLRHFAGDDLGVCTRTSTDIRAGIEQHLHHLRMFFSRRPHQGGLIMLWLLRIYLRARAYERFHGSGISRPGAVHRYRFPIEERRVRSEEHTSELQSLRHLVCRLLLEKKKYNK